MGNGGLNTGVLVISGIALTITAMSVYVSRVYLPMKIKEAYLKSITVLAAAVETKDSGTVGHAQRVAQLTVEVARRLGLYGRALERIEYAALLRDIGKANVPHAILNKVEKLTLEEWEIVKSHSMLGEEMVAQIPFLADTARFIRHHHEYWDGSGYPDGLKGEEIPLESRILAVTSDYDAMVSVRPYHVNAMDSNSAIMDIQQDSGRKYDPSVVDVFLNVMSDRIAMDEDECVIRD